VEERSEDASSNHIYIFLGGVSPRDQPKASNLTYLSTICYANIKPSMNHAQLAFNILCKSSLYLLPTSTDISQLVSVKVVRSPSLLHLSNSHRPTLTFPPQPGLHSLPEPLAELSGPQFWVPSSTASSPRLTLPPFQMLPPKLACQALRSLLYLKLSRPVLDSQISREFRQQSWQQQRTRVRKVMRQLTDWLGRVSFHLWCWLSSQLCS
jgi:hypothetical protein